MKISTELEAFHGATRPLFKSDEDHTEFMRRAFVPAMKEIPNSMKKVFENLEPSQDGALAPILQKMQEDVTQSVAAGVEPDRALAAAAVKFMPGGGVSSLFN